MSLKKMLLVNTSNQQKYPLDCIESIIGRGWLDCQDKRISRKHGIIKICPDGVMLKSSHVNPIFYRMKDDTIIQLIMIENEVSLNIGDSFGLLPDEFWFRIEETCDNNESLNKINENTNENLQGENRNNGNNKTSNENNESASNSDETNRQEAIVDGETNSKRPLETTEFSDSKKSKSSDGEIEIIEPIVPVVEIKEENTNEEKNIRIKTEPKDNVSDGQGPSCSSNNNVEVKKENNHRDCCPHGLRCYRRNMVHSREMAHPGDRDYRMPDYARYIPNVPSCPYGLRCYRRNPIHFDQYSHPSSDKKKDDNSNNQNGNVNQLNQENDDNDDDDEEEDPFAADTDEFDSDYHTEKIDGDHEL